MDRKKVLPFLKKIFYFVLPVILLFLIFQNIEFSKLRSQFVNMEFSFFLLALSIMPLSVLFGSYRWYVLNNFYYGERLPLKFYTFHYWAGLAIGYFTPGNIGWDAYRIINVSKKLRSYLAPVVAIISEKLIALTSILLMILILFPVVIDEVVKQVELLKRIYFVGVAVFTGISLFLFFYKTFENKFSSLQLERKLKSIFLRFIRKTKLKRALIDSERSDFTFPNLLTIVNSPRLLILAVLVSWGILIISAIVNHFYFLAVGYEIDFMINLLAAPVFFILFFVPLSFGSLGVREGVYILFYGLFDVPAEIALLVSFFHLTGILFNSVIGAAAIFLKGLVQTKIF